MRPDTPQDLIQRLIHIGAQLSSERDLNHLLEMIVDESRRFTGADGGTLFLINEATQSLDWAIIQNESMGVRVGGRSEQAPDHQTFRPIPLGGDLSNVAAFVAATGQSVNIADVYDEHDEFDFEGPQRFDAQTGYRTQSMLVVPLRHFEGGVIGVLQLINARDLSSGELIKFSPDFEALTASMASQAAVAVKNAQLFDEVEAQFEAFIRTIATAIDEKSPYTSGHVRRVVDLTLRIAHAINRADQGRFAQVSFNEDELKALRVASWMHDIGKIATPEYVVDKATKLSTIFDRIELIQTRYDYIASALEAAALRELLDSPTSSKTTVQAQLQAELDALQDELEFIRQCNLGAEFMSDERLERLVSIAQKTYLDARGQRRPRLTPDELENLSIRRGTLTPEEIQIIREHANISYKMLSQLPFTRHLSQVPEIAAGHHEKLNGKGYPRGLSAEELSLQARILAVADIFEALTAADRPYKQPTPLSGVKRILDAMVKDGDLDPDLVEFAMRSGVFDEYAAQEVLAHQRDYAFGQLNTASAEPSKSRHS